MDATEDGTNEKSKEDGEKLQEGSELTEAPPRIQARVTVLPGDRGSVMQASSSVGSRNERNRTVTEHTAIFSMDNSDGVGSEEEDDEQEEFDLTDNTIEKMGSERFGAQRLSFMFEHNNFMNMRIQALVCDLRNNNLLLQDECEEEGIPAAASRQSRRSRVGSRVSFVPEQRVADADQNDETEQNPNLSRSPSQTSVGDEKSFPKKAVPSFSKSRPRKNSILPDDHEKIAKMAALESRNAELERRNAELEKILKDATASVTNAKVTEDSAISSPDLAQALVKGAEVADKFAYEREKEESSRLRKQIAELRAELDTERKRACQSDKDNAGLRRDLKKCQHVIERLVKELEMATRTVAPPPPVVPASRPSVAQPPPSAKQAPMPPSTSSSGKRNSNVPASLAAEKSSTTVEQSSKMPPSAGDLEKMIRRDMERQESAAQPGFMSDLSSAIGAFFGQLGTAKPNPATTPANASDADDFDEPFCWAEEPHGRNVNIDEDGQTATFTSNEKTALHAYVVTEEPPLLENDQGYGFEVLIKKVRTGLEDGLAIGFTATPPDMWPEELPETADLIEQSWLVGYNGEMYDGGSEQWHQCPWSPAHLSEGDRVGVQVSQDGKFFVVVNQKVVYSTSIPIVSDGPPLFGVVDLLGNTDAVTLLD